MQQKKYQAHTEEPPLINRIIIPSKAAKETCRTCLEIPRLIKQIQMINISAVANKFHKLKLNS